MERARLQYPGDDRCGGRATIEKQSERKLKIEWLMAELCAGTTENAAFGHFS
jgi:hypothetical protein